MTYHTLEDIDYVEADFDFNEESIDIQFHLSTYTVNKIKLLYGINIHTTFFIHLMDDHPKLHGLYSSIPKGYVYKDCFILPFKVFNLFIRKINISQHFNADTMKVIKVAEQNTDSYEHIHEFLKRHHQEFIDSLNVVHQRYK